MTFEIELIKNIIERMRTEGALAIIGGESLRVDTGARIPYTSDFRELRGKEPSRNEHETGLLLYDQLDEKWWTPRVVLECKLDDVTPYDAFTYSARATSHKRAHPYLRYGILLDGRRERSGYVSPFSYTNHFDFKVRWAGERATMAEWESFLAMLEEEIQVSRDVQEIRGSNIGR